MREPEWWPIALFALVLVWLVGWARLEGRGGGLWILLGHWWRWLRNLIGW